jgi:signal transduction histidine kinase
LKSDLIFVGNSTPEIVESMRAGLAQFGYSLHAVGPGELSQAVRTVTPGAVLVDVSLPQVNGVQLCAQLKADSAPLPVIALNQGEVALSRAALAAGADTVMSHPPDWKTLHAWLSAPVHTTATILGDNGPETLGMVGLLGHDLKSPISIIISTLEVLISLHDGDEALESSLRLLRGALSAAYRQINMVSDLLDLARLEMNAYEFNRQPVDLVRLVEETLDAESYTFETKKLRLEKVFSSTPVIVDADGDLIRRVVIALVDNAIKFTIRDDGLKVSVQQVGDQAHIAFTDTGRPVSPELAQAILHRASQWEWRQNGARTSVGMGLPFCLAVARAHGGDLTAQADPTAKASTFTVSLPSHKPEAS